VLERIFRESERSEIFGGSNISISDRLIAKMTSTWQLKEVGSQSSLRLVDGVWRMFKYAGPFSRHTFP
jgi:hypothetical protein